MSNGFDVVAQNLRTRYQKVQGSGEQIPPGYDLIENRVLDSLGFVEFILLLEEHSGREISIDSVSREDFRTVESIRKRFFDDV
ncbi:hypothetical protein [Kineosporia sp. NBRC 101731]|uniref:hypothetical protein n=1 Tax=Kineosporia sp. NBRC 101731 TaxID=3032199 RepID=UPI0024A4A71C|nr:hypothetical protein [Kineosporia sp. NBRC 101731]GLY32623.1 hypothetical protein Kisp02_59880 [Kineosporia sp. NBRC 101731]